MRDKQPVTRREYPFPATQARLSATDRSSHITCANAAPLRRNGQRVGHFPVRTQPSRTAVEASGKIKTRVAAMTGTSRPDDRQDAAMAEPGSAAALQVFSP